MIFEGFGTGESSFTLERGFFFALRDRPALPGNDRERLAHVEHLVALHDAQTVAVEAAEFHSVGLLISPPSATRPQLDACASKLKLMWPASECASRKMRSSG